MVESLRDGIEAEEPLSEGPAPAVVFSVPGWLRLTAAFFLAFGFAGSILLLISYFVGQKPEWEPSEIDLVDFILFCFIGLGLCALPWERYQFRIRRIGPVEFEQILSAQARERDEALHEIRQRVQDLETKQRVVGVDERKTPPISVDPKLTQLLKAFLETNKRAFSPLRIATWGAQQPNFGKLGKHNIQEIRSALQSMVANGELETVISKRGNTLYRVAGE
jgi:hypothetical protein